MRAERRAQGLSQEALANKADIDRSYMGGIERGEHNIAIINFLKYACLTCYFHLRHSER